MIYFIQAGKGGPIKIGVANDPVARLNQLQTATHETLRLLAVMDGDEHTEFELHQQFGADRLRGEWFRPSEDLLWYIRSKGQHQDRTAVNRQVECAAIRSGLLLLLIISAFSIVTRFWVPIWIGPPSSTTTLLIVGVGIIFYFIVRRLRHQ